MTINSEHQPILNALTRIKKYVDGNKVYFSDNENALRYCLPDKWQKRIVDPQTLSVMSPHLLQLSMGYINTLMIQQIIEEHGLENKLTTEDKRALPPLIYEYVNPYGLFPLDLSTGLPHLHYKAVA